MAGEELGGTGRPDPAYVERLGPGPGLWAATAALALGIGFTVFAVFGPALGLLAALGPGVLLGLALSRTAAEVRVEGGHLVAGDARVPIADLGPARALDAEEARRVRGPESDPSAYHLIRPSVRAGILAQVVDPDDPTPYWFVASRSPEQLAAAIEAARAG